MKTRNFKFLIGAAFLGGAMTIGAGAQAYWGGPWGGPESGPDWGGPWGGPESGPDWGGPRSGPGQPFGGYSREGFERMHERQREMHDHKETMQSVARMLSGRRSFDRTEAIGLAREIEASAGDNLSQLFKSDDWRRNPLSRARIGRDKMEKFQAHADALKEAAGALADALEKQPSAEDVGAGRAWYPDRRHSGRVWGVGGPYGLRRNTGKALTREVLDAYDRLEATCHGCHAKFRSPRR